jgi:dihydrofolate reductase
MMQKRNSVFIATSLDGYIADENGGVEWLHTTANPDNIDMGYSSFMSRVDALVMGRTTFETVCAFDIEWPYDKPVYVLSNTIHEVPEGYKGKIELVKGSLHEVLELIHSRGHYRLYIDGGLTIQGFLKEDLIDEMVITRIPILLGGGSPLFSQVDDPLVFDCVQTEIYLEKIVQNCFERLR